MKYKYYLRDTTSPRKLEKTLPIDSLYIEVGTRPMGQASDPKVIMTAYTYLAY
jgi:hypothetical protein